MKKIQILVLSTKIIPCNLNKKLLIILKITQLIAPLKNLESIEKASRNGRSKKRVTFRLEGGGRKIKLEAAEKGTERKLHVSRNRLKLTPSEEWVSKFLLRNNLTMRRSNNNLPKATRGICSKNY